MAEARQHSSQGTYPFWDQGVDRWLETARAAQELWGSGARFWMDQAVEVQTGVRQSCDGWLQAVNAVQQQVLEGWYGNLGLGAQTLARCRPWDAATQPAQRHSANAADESSPG